MGLAINLPFFYQNPSLLSIVVVMYVNHEAFVVAFENPSQGQKELPRMFSDWSPYPTEDARRNLALRLRDYDSVGSFFHSGMFMSSKLYQLLDYFMVSRSHVVSNVSPTLPLSSPEMP